MKTGKKAKWNEKKTCYPTPFFFLRASRLLRFFAFFSSCDIAAYLALSLSRLRCLLLLFADGELGTLSDPAL